MELKKLELDVKTGKLTVNGADYSDVSKFNLHYENGLFALEITDKFYATGKKIAEPVKNKLSNSSKEQILK